MTNSNKHQTSDFVSISYKIWQPTETSSLKGIVQILHGMAEHKNRYDHFAKYLNSQGYVVVAHDHRGHGESIQNDLSGHFADKNGWKLVVSDVHEIYQLVKKSYPDLPWILFAHSMGSIIGQKYISLHGHLYKAVILSGMPLPNRLKTWLGRYVVKAESLRLGSTAKSALVKEISFGPNNKAFKPNRTPYDWLSRDHKQVDLYMNDPLCGFMCSNQLWLDFLQGLLEVTHPNFYKTIVSSLPIHFLYGSDDPVVNQSVKKHFKHCQNLNKKVSIKEYTNSRHETLNEINRNEVYEHIAQWIDQLT